MQAADHRTLRKSKGGPPPGWAQKHKQVPRFARNDTCSRADGVAGWFGPEASGLTRSGSAGLTTSKPASTPAPGMAVSRVATRPPTQNASGVGVGCGERRKACFGLCASGLGLRAWRCHSEPLIALAARNLHLADKNVCPTRFFLRWKGKPAVTLKRERGTRASA